MTRRLDCKLALPSGFRSADLLAFHRRDPQEVAERVGVETLEKGIVWRGAPACLRLRLGSRSVAAQLETDGNPGRAASAALEAMIRRMLGIDQCVEQFERRYRRHGQLGSLICGRSGLRVPAAATPFEALTWAVTGQQISVAAAVSLRRKLILAAELRHSSGLLCYPDAPRIAALTVERLRSAGFSMAKAETLRRLASLVVCGELPLDDWAQTLPVDQIQQRLLAVRGIGPWTVDYALLRGFGWLDGSLHGDAAVRRGMQTLLASERPISANEAKEWLAQFSPWRALVAAHLWATQSATAY